MFLELAPRVSKMILTRADHPRSEDPEVLADLAHAFGFEVKVIEPVAAALQAAVREAGSEDVILATGSLFVVGSRLAAWDAKDRTFRIEEQ